MLQISQSYFILCHWSHSHISISRAVSHFYILQLNMTSFCYFRLNIYQFYYIKSQQILPKVELHVCGVYLVSFFICFVFVFFFVCFIFI